MVKIRKQNTFVDMTAMSDVTILLLIFFMLTSAFVSKDLVQITVPSSISAIKIPETNIMTILVDMNGKIFISLNYQQDLVVQTLKAVGKDYGCEFTLSQCESFKKLKSFGVPISFMPFFLDLSEKEQDKYMKDLTNSRIGIPSEDVKSKDNEFIRWVSHAIDCNPNLQIAIKADRQTSYPVIKKVIDDLRNVRKSRFLLITNLKTTDK